MKKLTLSTILVLMALVVQGQSDILRVYEVEDGRNYCKNSRIFDHFCSTLNYFTARVLISDS